MAIKTMDVKGSFKDTYMKESIDKKAMQAAQKRWNDIAKPVGSLGALEDVIIRLAGITKNSNPVIDKRAVIVACADNGIVAQGVAQTPGEITAVMASFIAEGRSSVCIMAKAANTDVITVDMGMFSRLPEAKILDRRLGDGTKDMSICPAMSLEQAKRGVETGIELVGQLKQEGYQIIATGEMGIGNTTSSSAVAAALLDLKVEDVTGRGVGLTDEGLLRKINAIKKAIEINKPDKADGLDVLSKLGGFDIAALCGVFLGGERHGVPILIDGFISSVSALLAYRLSPSARDFMIASHLSAEPAARKILDELELSPLIDARFRLGEGTGAVAALPLIDMGLAVYRDLMTYEDIGM